MSMNKKELLASLEEIRKEVKALLEDLKGGRVRKKDWRRMRRNEVSD